MAQLLNQEKGADLILQHDVIEHEKEKMSKENHPCLEDIIEGTVKIDGQRAHGVRKF